MVDPGSISGKDTTRRFLRRGPVAARSPGAPDAAGAPVSWTIVIPVKAPAAAKTRLAAAVPPALRAELARAFALDTIAAAIAARSVSRIIVVGDDPSMAGGAEFLAQGTLYPDVIESVSFTGGPSVTIKSHHNVGVLPERMNMQLVEPLRELFKDEVRALGRELGLPESFIGRHPFPGPGLAIRCPGGITPEKLDILRQADAIYLDEIRKSGQYDKIWQAFAVLLPVQTVGVMGDGRTYEFVCALRAVTSVDGMTADFYHYDMEFLGRAATRIINEVRGINRVVYDVTSKPPGTIEWE